MRFFRRQRAEKREPGRFKRMFAKLIPKWKRKPGTPEIQPAFRQQATPGSYLIGKARKWIYKDHQPRGYQSEVVNPIEKFKVKWPCIFLCDSRQRPRFVLQYEVVPGGFDLTAIQRERTEYEKIYEGQLGVTYKWDAVAETASSKKFGEALGMHPSEFLVSEFIFLNRKNIRRGRRITLCKGNTNPNQKVYRAVIERFFKWNEIEKEYELSLEKRRVKEILSIP